jgi:outer membrane protein assembly factor BamB
VGDQSGRVSAFNPTTGATLWTTASLGTAIEAQPIAQLAQFSNAAYTAARGAVDLIFVGTRQTPAANRVFALNAATGAVVWTYAPGTLDLISGGGTVDYTRNEVWIPSRTGLAVLDTRTGAQVALVTGAGAFDRGLSFNSTTKQVYAVNNAGTALGFDNVTHAQVWSVNVGLAPSSYLYPVSSTVNGAQGFIFSSAAGNVVRRYNFTSPTVAVQAWSTAVPGATGAYVATLNGVDKLHVGTNDGRLLRLHTETGAIERALTFVTGTGQRVVGMPSVDPSVPGGGRVTAGTSDGRVCGFSL